MVMLVRRHVLSQLKVCKQFNQHKFQSVRCSVVIYSNSLVAYRLVMLLDRCYKNQDGVVRQDFFVINNHSFIILSTIDPSLRTDFLG